MHPMLNTAVKAARRAGQIINRASKTWIRSRSNTRALMILSAKWIKKRKMPSRSPAGRYPKHAILARRSGAQGDSEFQ